MSNFELTQSFIRQVTARSKALLLTRNSKKIFEKRFSCKICKKTFATKQNAIIHSSIHTGVCPFKCSKCPNVAFRSNFQLMRHNRYKHEKYRPHKCTICQMEFVEACKLRRHTDLVHKKVKEYTCDICNFHCRDSSNLKTHQRKHSGEKPFNCQLCERNFSNKQSLQRHLATGVIGICAGKMKCTKCCLSFRHRKTFRFHLKCCSQN